MSSENESIVTTTKVSFTEKKVLYFKVSIISILIKLSYLKLVFSEGTVNLTPPQPI